MIKVAVLADTHVPKRAKRLPEPAYAILRQVDAIIHAGDVLTGEFLQSLNMMAPVHAVLGNNDIDLQLPEQLELCWENVRIGVIHDSGPAKGRAQRLRKQFPLVDLVIFGHSHIPVNSHDEGLLLFNPGSATDRRRQPKHTMGMLVLNQGLIDARIIELD